MFKRTMGAVKNSLLNKKRESICKTNEQENISKKITIDDSLKNYSFSGKNDEKIGRKRLDSSGGCFGIELVVVNILGFIGPMMNVRDVISFSHVCSEWRRICGLDHVEFEFCNRFPSRETHRVRDYALKDIFVQLEMVQFFTKATIHLEQRGSIKFIENFTKCKEFEVHFIRKIDWKSIEIVLEKVSRLKLVCKFTKKDKKCLMSEIVRIFPNLKHLELDCIDLSNDSVDILLQSIYPNLETFKIIVEKYNLDIPLYKFFFSDQVFEKMIDFSCLVEGPKKLLFINDERNYPNLRSLNTYTQLTNISFGNLTRLEIFPAFALENSNFQNLEQLIIEQQFYDHEFVAIPIMKASKLKILRMKSMKIGLENIDQFENLEKLTIECSQMASDDMRVLENIKNLTEISISSFFSRGSFPKLSKSVQFTKLKVKSIHAFESYPTLDLEDVKYISQLESLQYLEINLGGSDQFEELIRGNLPNLTHLNLKNKLNRENILSLVQSNMKKLKTLGIVEADKPMTKVFKRYSLP